MAARPETVAQCPDCGTAMAYYGRGPVPRCKPCQLKRKRERDRKWRLDNPEKSKEHNRRWRAANPEKALESQRRSEAKRVRDRTLTYRKWGRAAHVRKKYGITLDLYDSVLAGGCGVCGGVADCLDHDHKTGAIRGGLCTHCNQGLGRFHDKPELLRAAADYIEGRLPLFFVSGRKA